MTLILCLLALFGALVLTVDRAGAQSLVQYTPPGGPQEQPESRRELLERQIEAARYHLGPVHVAPWATLRDLAYVHNLYSAGQQLPPNDFTATVGAGFRAYLRNGSKATWIGQVLPEYVWWQKQDQRRQLNGRYLLGFAGYFNHLTLEVQAGRQQQQQIVTPEVPVPVSSRNDGGELLAELRLARSLSLFAVTSINRQNNLVDDLRDPRTGALRLLDREDRAERLGLRWRPERRWSFGVAGERTESDFTHQGAFDRSNSGTAPVVEARFRGNHLSFETEAADRSLTARREANLVPFHGVTGSAAVTVGGEHQRAAATLYTSRNLVYSLSPLYPYFTDQRLGASLTVGVGQRTHGRVFVEGGRNDYTAFSAATPRRLEDVSSYGGTLTFELHRSLRLGIEGVRSHYDAHLPGESRTYTSIGATISLAEVP
ncbi:MAG TPA: hypothetical protein VGM86_31235 [Thermoanaerobaculia bacterium]